MNNPLAALRGIHEPTTVPWWPPGPGWWLTALLLALAAALLWWWRQQRPLHTWLQARHALLQLELLRTDYLDFQRDAKYLRGINAILRRLALCHHPQALVAPLSGSQWLAFLDRQAAAGEDFSRGCGTVLGHPSYAATPAITDAEQLHRLACDWARRQGNPIRLPTREIPA